MWESIKQLVENGNYVQAKQELDKEKAVSGCPDDLFAVLDASVCEAMGDEDGMFDAIAAGLACNPENYELYYLLGCFYYKKNPDQAFLCFQNALFYCGNKEDLDVIRAGMEALRQDYDITVRNTDIVIVSYNACYLLQKNLESIRNTLLKGTYRIIAVDNASDDGAAEWLEEQEDVILIRNRENKGFAHACNQGAAAVSDEESRENNIFLLNNDTRLAVNSLFWLRMGLYENEKTGAAGSYSNYAGNEQQLDIAFTLPGEYLQYGAKLNIPLRHPYEERVRLSGFAMLIKRNAWNLAGGMDERFTPGYFEDDDLSMQILQKGYRLVLCRNSFIYHAGSQSFKDREDVEQILQEHHGLFIKKYGFDILEYAYPAKDLTAGIPYGERDEYNILQIGSGLGADLKWLRTVYPGAHGVGLETDEALFRSSADTEAVFRNAEDLTQVFNIPVFDVLIMNQRVYGTLSDNDKRILAGLCKRNCALLPAINPYDTFPFDKIKLVIWDLDDTFWQGTLSEGNVSFSEKNIRLVRDLADHGIVNSISSKNDASHVNSVLQQLKLESLFVFNDINWDDKGIQIRQKLADMGLRAENTLFIDDNARNLEEAVCMNEGILTASPDIIPYLANYAYSCRVADIGHKRLAGYKVLEKKRTVRKKFDTQEAFLYDSDIRIEVMDNCFDELDRIEELVRRTNQLNFTKVRSSREELSRMLANDWKDCGYIKVSDKYGDYGIVGFYCFDRQKNRLEHFLFSCRILGMKVEQYVYRKLGYPKIEVVQPVAGALEQGTVIPWISEKAGITHLPDASGENRVRILMKGPCDMSAIESYLTGGKVTTEFNYINNRNFITAGQNHSMHIWESANCRDSEIDAILREVPFLTQGDFETMLFRKEYHVVCYSLLPDCHAGLYRNKQTGLYASFGSVNFDLTDEKNIPGYIDGTCTNHLYPFTEKIIKDFAGKWEFVGTTPPELLIRNLDYMYEHAPGRPRFVLLLGSEIEYEGINEEFANHAPRHKEINRLVREFAEDRERITLVNTTDFIRSQADYEDCINHFSRNVYYDLATAVCSCINNRMQM